MKRNRQAELIRQLTDRELIQQLYVTQLILLALSGISGWILFHRLEQFTDLLHVNWRLAAIGLTSGVLVALLDILAMRLLPVRYYDDGGINRRIFSSCSYPQIILLTFIIAVSEEILFRGVIQTHFGLAVASVIFALIHVRYWSHWYLFINVLVLSFWIGTLYHWAGQQLLPVIAMHFAIDLILGVYVKWTSKTHQ